jgi:hypothetical protein
VIPDETTAIQNTNSNGEVYTTYSANKKSPDNEDYIHVNLRTIHNIRERAEALTLERPEIAAALGRIPEFFITDAD